MPPEQCPECGVFLARAFVEETAAAPQPCPRCGAVIQVAAARTAPGGATGAEAGDDADEVVADVAVATATAADVAVATATADDAEEAEPPTRAHPLDDWGAGARPTKAVADPGRAHGRPSPQDLAAVGVGAFLGALLLGRHRVVGGLLGALVAGLVTAIRD